MYMYMVVTRPDMPDTDWHTQKASDVYDINSNFDWDEEF